MANDVAVDVKVRCLLIKILAETRTDRWGSKEEGAVGNGRDVWIIDGRARTLNNSGW